MKWLILISVTLIVMFNANACILKRSYNEGWISGSDDSTHAWIVEQALRLLEKSDKANSPVFAELKKNKARLESYANAPDVIENDFGTFRGHFFNPYTERNYVHMRYPTALDRFAQHNYEAIKYSINEPEFVRHIGMAAHFLADACQPYHARNRIAGFTWHSTFEWYALEIQDQFKYEDEVPPLRTDLRLGSALEAILTKCAFQAYKNYPDASARTGARHRLPVRVRSECYNGISWVWGRPDCERWKNAISKTLRNSQVAMFHYLYRIIVNFEQKDGAFDDY